MLQTHNNVTCLLTHRIKQLWSNLSDDEISLHTTMRDVFFMAVRKRYGIPRAQAEGILRDFEHELYAQAA